MPGKAQTTGSSLELDTDGSGSGGGDATAANQVIGNAFLSSIDGKLTNPIPVTAVNLDIRDLAFATDKVDVSGSTVNAVVAGTVAVSNFPASQAVTGPLTDVQLRATPVPVSGTVSTGGLTDTQLRATPVPVSGTVTVDTSLLATAAKQDTGNGSLGSIKTNTDPLVTSGGGGYVRQDSTATIAKETGGNLAILTEPVDTKADLLKTGSPTITNATSNATPVTTAATTDVVSAPSSGNHLEIKRLHASNGSATPVKVSWKEASGTERYHANLPQYGIVSIDLDFSWHLTTATKLQMVTSAAGSIDWTVDTRTVPD